MRVGSFLIVESVGTDEEGRDVLSGVIDSIAPRTTRHVSVYLELFMATGEDRQAKLSVRVVQPDGATTDFCRDIPVSLTAGIPCTHVVLRGRLEAWKSGTYEVQLLIDGQVLADRPLLVPPGTS